MSRILGVVAVIAFLFAAGCIALAVWITGGNFNFGDDFTGQPPLAQSAGSKQWAFSGDRLDLDVPAVLHQEPGSPARIIVQGDPGVIAQVKFAGGKLGGAHHWGPGGGPVNVTLRGAQVRRFAANGSGKLDLGHIDQDALRIDINGSGSADAEGRADVVEVHINGSGAVHLGALKAKVVRIHIAGSGAAEVAPSDAVDIHIAGSGKVVLSTKPKSVSTHIAGSGQIVEP